MEQKGFTLWFTGLPCSGKSSMADAMFEKLRQKKLKTERLDADVIRKHLWKELGFSKEDRDENIRRAAYLASLLTRNGIITITSFISPYRELRDYARQEIGDFVEIYVKCPMDVCIQRDTRGLYKKALAGEIKNFTGISDPYEEPLNPEVVVDTEHESIEQGVDKIMSVAVRLGFFGTGTGMVAP